MSNEESVSYLKKCGMDMETGNLIYNLVGGRLSLLAAMVSELNSGLSFEGITFFLNHYRFEKNTCLNRWWSI